MASFIYAEGDATKTPVDLAAQPINTKLVLVTEEGRTVSFNAGKRMSNDPAAVKAKVAAARARPAGYEG